MRTTRRSRALALAAGLTAGALLLGCSSSSTKTSTGSSVPAPAAAIDLKIPQNLKIGVIVSSSGPGAEVLDSADGARLAQYRLNGLKAGDGPVDLVVKDDHGDPAQATAAVESLKQAGVSGIVYASLGPQLKPAIDRAANLGIPVLVPYDDGQSQAGNHDNTWVTGVSPTAAISTLAAYEKKAKLNPLVLVVDKPAVGNLSSLGSKQVTVDDPSTSTALDQQLAGLAPQAKYDSIVVWGSADHVAEVVAGLQRQGFNKPILASSNVLHPPFSAELNKQAETGDAGTETTLVTAGPAVTDLDNTPGIAGFLHSLRVGSADPKLKALLGVKALGGDSGYAAVDTGAHDAVLLLAAAASKSGSTDPKQLTQVLEPLQAANLAGPSPNLGTHAGLSGDQVVPLQADALLGGPRSSLPGAPEVSWYRAKAVSSGS